MNITASKNSDNCSEAELKVETGMYSADSMQCSAHLSDVSCSRIVFTSACFRC